MFSVLFLLIGITKHKQLFEEFKYDTANNIKFVKTNIFQDISHTKQEAEKVKFNIDGDGEIMRTIETKNGIITYHYRALTVPKLQNNYESFPELKLEIIKDNQKQMVETEIYKVDRNKGLVYFLLKTERNHQTIPTNLYTGTYIVNLIK